MPWRSSVLASDCARFFELPRAHFKTSSSKAPAYKKLTAREIEVVELVGQGYTDNEIALKLGISARTAQQHIVSARNKLGSRSRSEAAAQLFEARKPSAAS
jgi:NarL family two-component system response regulator LiaR